MGNRPGEKSPGFFVFNRRIFPDKEVLDLGDVLHYVN